MAGLFEKIAGEYKQLNREADRLQIGVVAMQELEHASEKAGLELGDTTAAIAKMQKKIADAAAGEKTAQQAFRELGLSWSYLKDLSPDQAFENVARAIMTIQNPAERVRAEMEVFGKSGAQIGNVLKKAAEGLSQFESETLSPVDVKTLADANRELREMGEMLKVGLAEGFAVAAREAKEFMNAISGKGPGEERNMRADFERMRGWLMLFTFGPAGIGKAQDQFKLADEYERGDKLDKKNRELRKQQDARANAERLAAEAEQEWIDEISMEDWDKVVVKLTDNIDELLNPKSSFAKIRDEFLEKYDVTDEQREELDQWVEMGEAAKKFVDTQKEAQAAIRGARTEQEKYADAVRDAHKWAEMGVIGARDEEGLIAKAKKDLAQSLKSEVGELTPASLAMRDSREAYEAIVKSLYENDTQRMQLECLNRIATAAEQMAQEQPDRVASISP